MLRTAMTAALFFVCGAQVAFAQSPQGAASASVCVYHDRTYSEGAAICPQARFMLSCSVDQGKLVWRAVTDRSLSERCVVPTVVAERVRYRPPPRIQRIARTITAPAADPSAKCFVFNGKRYCE
jgi:hypothetical protein